MPQQTQTQQSSAEGVVGYKLDSKLGVCVLPVLWYTALRCIISCTHVSVFVCWHKYTSGNIGRQSMLMLRRMRERERARDFSFANTTTTHHRKSFLEQCTDTVAYSCHTRAEGRPRAPESHNPIEYGSLRQAGGGYDAPYNIMLSRLWYHEKVTRCDLRIDTTRLSRCCIRHI